MAKQATALASPKIDHRLAELPKPLGEQELKEITSLAQQAMELEKKIEEQEEETKLTREKLNAIVQDKLPNILLRSGVKKLELTTGEILETEDWVTANIKEENRPVAHAWLRANKFGSLIKTAVAVAFGMGDEKKAAKLYMELAKKYEDVSKEERVHSSTLRAFVKERLAQGEELPASINVHSIPTTTIKEARKQK